jgi:hypothetical protein
MSMNVRTQTIHRVVVPLSLLVVSLLVGGVGGYSLATARALSAAPQAAVTEPHLTAPTSSSVEDPTSPQYAAASRTRAGELAPARTPAFSASEHQGSAENPNSISVAAPSNGPFLASEHQGSTENPSAAVASGPLNIAFLATEHQGSTESPSAVVSTGPRNTTFLSTEHQGTDENPDARN